MYKYKKGKKPELKVPVSKPEKEVEQVGSVQGIIPDSIEEWRVAKSLYKYKLPFQYQVSLFGGVGTRGGQKLDFLVMTPFREPLQIMGPYWHQDSNEELLTLEALKRYYQVDAHIIETPDIPDQQSSDEIIAEMFL